MRSITAPHLCSVSPPTASGITGRNLNRVPLVRASDNARYYDTTLGRFVSADTIVPSAGNPQSLNRYSYVLNNPVKYVDPSGHCPFGSNGTGSYHADNDNLIDCTRDDFANADWKQREDWMVAFQEMTGVGWFDNVEGILRYFGNNRRFKDSQWAKLSDAGVLIAIQDGWRVYNRLDPIDSYSAVSSDSNPATAWSKFFEVYLNPRSGREEVYNAWGIAEQMGVDYGLALAQAENLSEGLQSAYFVWWGNIYRTIVRDGFQVVDVATCSNIQCTAYRVREFPNITTPYNSGPFTEWFSTNVISGSFNFMYQLNHPPASFHSDY